jgi:hypothetical protein
MKKGLGRTKRFFTGPSKAERAARAAAEADAEVEATMMGAIAAAERGRRMNNLRRKAMRGERVDYGALRELAAHENIYLSSQDGSDDLGLSPKAAMCSSAGTAPSGRATTPWASVRSRRSSSRTSLTGRFLNEKPGPIYDFAGK